MAPEVLLDGLLLKKPPPDLLLLLENPLAPEEKLVRPPPENPLAPLASTGPARSDRTNIDNTNSDSDFLNLANLISPF